MNKEYMQALDDLFGLVTFQEGFARAQRYFDIIEEALQRLQNIDNANPDTALEILYSYAKLDRDRIEEGGIVTYAEEIEHNERIKPYYDAIKQVLLKSQEQEKVIKLIFEKMVNILLLELAENVDEYNERIVRNSQLTEEEFNLLRRYF